MRAISTRLVIGYNAILPRTPAHTHDLEVYKVVLNSLSNYMFCFLTVVRYPPSIRILIFKFWLAFHFWVFVL